MSDVDTSAEAVERLAQTIDSVPGYGVLNISTTLRALCAEREELRASFDLRWKADMRAIRLRREQDQDDDNLTWPDHADLVVWLLAERDRLAAEVERMREAAARVVDRTPTTDGLAAHKAIQSIRALPLPEAK